MVAATWTAIGAVHGSLTPCPLSSQERGETEGLTGRSRMLRPYETAGVAQVAGMAAASWRRCKARVLRSASPVSTKRRA